ncbi:MAG: ABC transporter permease [Anaerolineae bacterium]|nr:ABC transporter permease [Anaerolineae bacterium]
MNRIKRTGAVAERALAQLREDRRFLILTLVFPLLIIYFIKVIFDVLANPFFNASVYVVPYGAFVVHFITFILTAIVLVRERTAGTLARMFVSGFTQLDIIFGYLIAYSSLTTVQSLLVMSELNWLFSLEYTAAQFFATYLVMWLLAVISMALGILVSNFARNEGQVIPFIPLVIISIILSGILLPVDRLPEWSQPLSRITPLFYANQILQELISGGELHSNLSILAQLILYGIAVMAIAMFTLREKD